MKPLILATALALAFLSPLPVLTLNVNAAEQQLEAGEVGNDQMVTYYEKGMIGNNVWVIDSRPPGKYISGHIPGAVSLPLDVLKQDPASVVKLGLPKSGKIVFYCAGRECTLSIDSAEIFKKMGYADSWVYRNGVPGWNQKMQPLRAEEQFVKRGNVILIDTAPGKETVVTAANKTLQLSLNDLKGEKGKAVLGPLSKNAPLVVVGRGEMESINAVLEELRELDFRRLAYLPVNAWKDKLTMASPVTNLTWAPVYGPGQVSPKAFETAVASGQFILDVRPATDFARGHFKGAVNIPVIELEKEYAKVPRDRPVFVNCATGATSQKSFDILGRKGYTNIAYLDAEISCKGESCTIKE